MKTLFVLSALAEILLLVALFWAGRKHVLSGLRHPYPGLVRLLKEPRAAMIIPITGDTPAVRLGLESLLAQDYPNLRYVLVTHDEADPATEVARSLIQGRDNATHLLSGPAVACGQKNHSLLAGLATVRDWADIYIFCDSTHLARPDLARLLLEPIALGKASISSGFHRIVPPGRGRAHPGHAKRLPVLAQRPAHPGHHSALGRGHGRFPARPSKSSGWLRFGRRTSWTISPWGLFWPSGASGLGQLPTPAWKRRSRTFPFSLWQAWLTRQLLYLKFCTPEMWVGSLAVVWLFGAPPVLAALGSLGALTGMAGSWWLGAAVCYAAAFAAVGMAFRTLSPKPVGAWDWIKSFFRHAPDDRVVLPAHLDHVHHELARHSLQSDLGAAGWWRSSGSDRVGGLPSVSRMF